MNGMMEMVMGFDGMKKGIKHIPGPEVSGSGRGARPCGAGASGATACRRKLAALPARPRCATLPASACLLWCCAGCARAQQRQQADPGEAGVGAHHQAGGASGPLVLGRGRPCVMSHSHSQRQETGKSGRTRAPIHCCWGAGEALVAGRVFTSTHHHPASSSLPRRTACA